MIIRLDTETIVLHWHGCVPVKSPNQSTWAGNQKKFTDWIEMVKVANGNHKFHILNTFCQSQNVGGIIIVSSHWAIAKVQDEKAF